MSQISKISQTETRDKYLALADRQEPKIARALVDGFDQIRNSLSLNELIEIVERQDINALMQILNNASFVVAFDLFGAALGSTSLKGMETFTAMQEPVKGPQNTIVNFTFNVANPKVAEASRQQAATRIQKISNQTRNMVRSIIQEEAVLGTGPYETARRIKGSIGLTQSQEKSVQNYRNALNRGSLSALDRELRDRRFDGSVINDKLTQDKIDKMVARYRDRYVKYRSQVIARTETTRAIQEAQHALLQSYVDEGKLDARQIRREWIYTHDGRTRPAHVQIPSMNEGGVGLNERFITPLGPMLYPADPSGLPENSIQCRCTVFSRILSMELVDG